MHSTPGSATGMPLPSPASGLCRLHNLSFRAMEDTPGFARWESREYELVVLVRMDPETQAITEAKVFASGEPGAETFPR